MFDIVFDQVRSAILVLIDMTKIESIDLGRGRNEKNSNKNILPMNRKKNSNKLVSLRLELRSRESEPRVITTYTMRPMQFCHAGVLKLCNTNMFNADLTGFYTVLLRT